ncbi:hypothetical protein ACX1Q6_002247 [Enterococcus hirae]|uniref:hypothetical protein n=1 Tax=Enterococcus hirae TaxID=1354 RepID=UPI0025724E86|nr:hypothetical protein [Enterococcus hirae]EMF0521981.1 hypothetical protein [Enterococcus hirae]BDX48162.1 hypothetical protein L6E_25760 [Enterococcus hirae]
MNKTQKINFNGGFVELFVPQLPKYEQEKWKIRLYGKITASDETTKAEGKRILLKNGFTTNGNKINEFYKIIEVNFF